MSFENELKTLITTWLTQGADRSELVMSLNDAADDLEDGTLDGVDDEASEDDLA
jgi:hypothetical protein